MVDRNGIPLACVTSAANVNDCKVLEEVIDAIPPVYNGKPEAPRFRPDKLHADKGYDFDFCRDLLHKRGIVPRIARRGIESKDRLSRHRWVVERTHAWLNKYRRLRIRYEIRDDIHWAFLEIGCALICFRALTRLC